MDAKGSLFRELQLQQAQGEIRQFALATAQKYNLATIEAIHVISGALMSEAQGLTALLMRHEREGG